MVHEASQSPNHSAKSSFSPEAVAANRLLKLPQVLEKVPVSKTEWYRRVKAGIAPQPVSLGVRAVAWREGDIDSYINSLAQGVRK